jgi:hypothetical protein
MTRTSERATWIRLAFVVGLVLAALFLLPHADAAEAFSSASGAAAAQQPGPTFVPISVCQGCSTLPFGINDRGQVTGVYFDASGKGRGFLKSGSTYDVIDIPGAQFVEAQRSNNRGHVVGDYVAADGLGRPWVRHPNGTIDLKPAYPGATFTGAIYITEDDVILGYATRDPAQAAGYFGYVLKGNTYVETFSYPGPNVVSTFPVSLNRRGEMVGSVEFGTIENEHGWYRSRDGHYRLIDYPGAVQSEAFDITDDGLILGRYQDSRGINHGFFLKDGVFTSFDYVGPQTYIWKINAHGTVVGYSFQQNAYGPPASGFEVQYPGA